MDDAITASGIFNEFDPDDPEFSLTVASEILDLRAENARLAADLKKARALLQPLADAYELPKVRIGDLINSVHTQRAYLFLNETKGGE